MFKLELLNERRVILGKEPLKSWKGSAAKLDEAITRTVTQSRHNGAAI